MATTSQVERKHRITVHAFFGGIATLPAVQHWWMYSGAIDDLELLKSFCTMVLINSFGGLIYATNILDGTLGKALNLPEVSHSVMHVFVVLAAWIYKQALVEQYTKVVYEDGVGTPTCLL